MKLVQPPTLETITRTHDYSIQAAAALRAFQAKRSLTAGRKIPENQLILDALLLDPDFAKIYVKIQHMPPEEVKAYIKAKS
jgi:hypothetical protein